MSMTRMRTPMQNPAYGPISFPEAAILLVSHGGGDLWPGPTPEVRDSLLVTLRMPIVKSDKSDWFWSQSIVFTKPFKTGMSLDLARGSDFQRMTKGTPGDEVAMWYACTSDACALETRRRFVTERGKKRESRNLSPGLNCLGNNIGLASL